MNILENLPFLSGKTEPEAPELTDEEQEAQAKAERIHFHRTQVRNGPATFRLPSLGDIRRANQRGLKRSQKKARRAQLKNYHETQRIASLTRGHLQLAGVLPFVVERELDRVQQVKSAVWLVQRFGTESDGAVDFGHDDVLLALSNALRFYGQAVGLPGLEMPADYVVPIYQESEAA